MTMCRSTKISVLFLIKIHLSCIIICIQSFVVDSYLINRNEGVSRRPSNVAMSKFLDGIQPGDSGMQEDEVPFFIRQAVMAGKDRL